MGQAVLSGRRWAKGEFGSAELGDARLTARLVRVAERIAAKPGESLPEAMPGWAELKGAYRLLSNPKATRSQVVGPHLSRTREACRGGGEWLLVEDTSTLSYGSHQAVKGLGPVNDAAESRGLLLHSTLALAVERWEADGEPKVTVEGLFGQHVWVRPEEKREKESSALRKNRGRESERWGRVFEESGGPPPGSRWTLVADREGDVYRALWDCVAHRVDFLIRAQQPRSMQGQDGSPFEAVAAAAVLGRMSVELRSRPGVPGRVAVLELRATRVTLLAPAGQRQWYGPCPATVVEAREIEAPKGAEPIQWVLLTSWEVASLAEAIRVVRSYAKRWLIEEYHKALKTGVGIERSQLETRERLEALLGILAVAAVRLLNMKLLCSSRPDEEVSASTLGPEALKILAAEHGMPQGGWTNRSLMVAIAKLGGFLGRKGDGNPGWITIWRGWNSLMLMVRGADLCRS
jgi:hypothetical protein